MLASLRPLRTAIWIFSYLPKNYTDPKSFPHLLHSLGSFAGERTLCLQDWPNATATSGLELSRRLTTTAIDPTRQMVAQLNGRFQSAAVAPPPRDNPSIPCIKISPIQHPLPACICRLLKGSGGRRSSATSTMADWLVSGLWLRIIDLQDIG